MKAPKDVMTVAHTNQDYLAEEANSKLLNGQPIKIVKCSCQGKERSVYMLFLEVKGFLVEK
jgi:hypothetical protein